MPEAPHGQCKVSSLKFASKGQTPGRVLTRPAIKSRSAVPPRGHLGSTSPWVRACQSPQMNAKSAVVSWVELMPTSQTEVSASTVRMVVFMPA
jgi:hypothetical protein